MQPQPPHSDLAADSGVYFSNGVLQTPTETGEPLVVRGETGATVTNMANVGVILSAGSYPGNEQPGQVCAIRLFVLRGGTALEMNQLIPLL